MEPDRAPSGRGGWWLPTGSTEMSTEIRENTLLLSLSVGVVKKREAVYGAVDLMQSLKPSTYSGTC